MLRSYLRDVGRMLRLSFPIIIAQIGSVLMGLTDYIMVGKLEGAAPLAAAGLANSIFFQVACIGIGIFAAVSPLVAKARSSKNDHECGLLLFAGMKLSVSLGLVLTVILLLVSANFEMFGQNHEVEVLAKSYLRVISTSIVPMMFFMAVKHFSDGLSLTVPAMIITMIGLVINVFFNWILIYGNLGFTAMGLYGAGLATLIARVIMACLMIVYVLESKFFQNFLPNILENYPTKLLTNNILKLGIPSGIQYFFEMAAFTGAAVIVGRFLGVTALASHNIILSIATVTYMTAAGVSFAGAISVGGAAGLKNRTKIIRAGTVTILLVSSLMLASSLILIIFGKEVIMVYSNTTEVVAIATPLLFIFIFYQLSDGIQAVGVGILRGISDVNIPTFIALFAYWIIGLPMGYLLGVKLSWGITGIWIGLSLGLTVSAILLTVRFYSLARHSKRFDIQIESTSI
jgi:multidrug resistance protein, MATE family